MTGYNRAVLYVVSGVSRTLVRSVRLQPDLFLQLSQ
jgi:hypothetical protein